MKAPQPQRSRGAIGYVITFLLAAIAIVLNLILPEELAAEATEEVSGGMSGHGEGSLPSE